MLYRVSSSDDNTLQNIYLMLKSGHGHGNDQGSELSITIGAPALVILLTVSPLDLLSCLQPLSTKNLFSISASLVFLE